MAVDRDTADDETSVRIDYTREKLDKELDEFGEFLSEAYGVQETHGDLETAVLTKREIDVEYVLDDARVRIASDGGNQDDPVTFEILAKDPAYAREIKNTIMDKASGEYNRLVENGVLYQGSLEQQREASYETVAPAVGIEEVLREYYDIDDPENITVRPLDDEINSRIGKIRRLYTDDGDLYISEGTIDLTDHAPDADDVSVHITQQKSYGDETAIRFVVESDDRDMLDEVYRLIHGRARAMQGDVAADTETDAGIADMFREAVTDTSLADVGGLDEVKQELVEDVIHPLKYPEEAAELGLSPTNGVLLSGPPGTGKTLLARAVAGETDVPFYNVDATELLDKYVGETEENIQELFDSVDEPCILFFDEADTAIPDRQQSDKEYTKSRTNTILQHLDGFEDNNDIVTIAATNLEEDMDDAGKRAGRLDAEYEITPPDRDGRAEILALKVQEQEQAATRDDLFADLDYGRLATVSDGATGADLEAWVDKAVRTAAYADGVDPDEPPQADTITTDHFLTAAAQFDFTADDALQGREFQ